jgi:hypothetical protein
MEDLLFCCKSSEKKNGIAARIMAQLEGESKKNSQGREMPENSRGWETPGWYHSRIPPPPLSTSRCSVSPLSRISVWCRISPKAIVEDSREYLQGLLFFVFIHMCVGKFFKII